MVLYSLYFTDRSHKLMGSPLLDDDNRPANSAETDIFIHAVERVLPNLPKRFFFSLSLFWAIMIYGFITSCVCAVA